MGIAFSIISGWLVGRELRVIFADDNRNKDR